MTSFAQSVLADIFASHPEWEEHHSTERGAEWHSPWIVSVPVPQAAQVEGPLDIWIRNDEFVRVAFDVLTSTFNGWSTAPIGEYAALPFVRALMDEEVAVASWWNGEQLRSSVAHTPDTAPVQLIPLEVTRLRVRSWRGTWNDDAPVSE